MNKKSGPSLLFALLSSCLVCVVPRYGAAEPAETAPRAFARPPGAQSPRGTSSTIVRAEKSVSPGGADLAVADREIEEAARRALQAELPGRTQVAVVATNGVVTLTGSVSSADTALKLVNRVSQLLHVREVRNRLTVVQNKDLEIAGQLRRALSLDPTTRSWAIDVSVIRGVVFLSGTALTEEEKNRAVELALGIDGVRQVSNGLQVPQISRYNLRYANQQKLSNPRSYLRAR